MSLVKEFDKLYPLQIAPFNYISSFLDIHGESRLTAVECIKDITNLINNPSKLKKSINYSKNMSWIEYEERDLDSSLIPAKKLNQKAKNSKNSEISFNLSNTK